MRTLLVSYYEDAWVDLDLLPRLDCFLVVPFQRSNPKAQVGKVYVTFNAQISTFFRKLVHGIKFTILLPYLIPKYDHFIFVTPPFFHALAMPFLIFLGKKTTSIVGDAYSEIAFEDLWQSSKSRKFSRKLLYIFYLASEYVGVRLNDSLFVVSQYLVEKYKRWGCSPVHTPNGTNVDEIMKIRPKHIVKENYVFYVGGLLKWRGIDLLMQAFKIVKQKYKKPLKLVVVGSKDFRYYPEIEELAKELGDDLVMTGYLPHKDAMAALKAARLAVLPNRNTIMSRTISSMKVFEYMASGIPQVCTDSGEHAYLVNRLKTGEVVAPSAEGIAEGILRVLRGNYEEALKKSTKHIDRKVFRKPIVEFAKSL